MNDQETLDTATYSWSCPHCEHVGYTKWNKSCYYQLTEHLQKNHLELAFNDVIEAIKRMNKKGKENTINNNWGILRKNIKELKEQG